MNNDVSRKQNQILLLLGPLDKRQAA